MDLEQLRQQLAAQVANNEITEEEAASILSQAEATGLLAGGDDQGTFEQILNDPPVQEQTFEPIEPGTMPVFENGMRHLEAAELQEIVRSDVRTEEDRARAQAEIEIRTEIQEQTFIQRLMNEQAQDRMVGAFGAAPALMGNALMNGLPELGAFGIDRAMGNSEIPLSTFLEGTIEGDNILREVYDVSSPLTAEESLMEALPGAVFGGVGGVAGDFLVDQSIRELTDDSTVEYETVFDRLGIAGPDQEPVMGPLAAIAAAGAAVTLTPATVRWWANRSPVNLGVMDRPSVFSGDANPRALDDIDPDAPGDLFTIEATQDLLTAGVVDQQTALAELGRRMGIPNIDFVRQNIDLQTHAAAGSRASEAMRTGMLTTLQRSFNSPTPPRLLYDTYQALPEPVRNDVATYINLLDMRDDARIALNNGLPGASQANLARLNSQLHSIEQRTPNVVEFSQRYNSVTGAMRMFMEDGLFSQARRQQLDIDHPNYVPLYITPIDPDANFMTRLQQAGRDTAGGPSDTDWFLQQRNSAGAYDIARRGDPFEHLMDYTNAALLAQMRNDTRLSYIDGMLESAQTHGYQFARLAEEGEAATNGQRIVSVFRNGEQENYITSSLTANLLQFDPQIAQYPALYGPRRIAEQTAVGPASVTFAPVTFIRDTLAGRVLRPEGLETGGFVQAAAAIPEQAYRRAQHSMSNYMLSRIRANGQAFPQLFGMDSGAQERFAISMAQSYSNSMFSQIRAAGGFNASDIVTNTRMATGRLREVGDTLATMARSNPVTNNFVTRFGLGATRRSIQGFVQMFESVIEAPRYSAIRRNIEAGMPVEEAALMGRQLTGDVSRSGTFTNSRGRMSPDIAYPSVFSNAVEVGGVGVDVIREGAMFINPMIQGNRRLWDAFASDPLGTQMRMFTNIGLPAMAAYAWNLSAGPEYAEFAMNGRTASDVAMNFYIGIPGLRPEEGIQIPIAHEMSMMNAPFMTAMHTMATDMGPETASEVFWALGSSILDTTFTVGTPVTFQAGSELAGLNLSDNLLQFETGSYETYQRPDDFVPDNVEQALRVLFTSVGDTALRTAYAFREEDDGMYASFESAYREAWNTTLRRAPLTSGLTGHEQTHAQFSIPGVINNRNENAMREFGLYYRMIRYQNGDGVHEYASRNPPGIDAHFPELAEDDFPNAYAGGLDVTAPTNPFIMQFGDMLHENLATNSMGYTGLDRRISRANAISRRLRNFTAGHEEELRAWMADLETAEDEDSIELREYLAERELDISVRGDRIELSNMLQARMNDLMRGQNYIVNNVENRMTEALRAVGVMGPDDEFDITRHLNPYDMPFEMTLEQSEAFQQHFQNN